MVFDLFKKKPKLSCQAKKILAWLDNKDLWKLHTNRLVNEQDLLVITYYSSEVFVDYKDNTLNEFFSKTELELIHNSTRELINQINKDIRSKQTQEAKLKFDELC